MISFPCLAFKENRVIFSKEELEEKFKEANACGKSCEISFYAFYEWYNSTPVEESVILDKVVLEGPEDCLRKIGEAKAKQGKKSILIFDGSKYYLLIITEEDSIEKLNNYKEVGCNVLTDLSKKFTLPGYPNLRTGRISRVVETWK